MADTRKSKHILCAVGLHRPTRGAVSWNGRSFVGHCRNCETTIVRRAPKIWTSYI
jgi:hypothetical protein